MSLTKISIRWFFFSFFTAIVSFIGIVYFSRTLGAQVLGIYFLFLSVLTVFNLFTNAGLQAATIKRISEGIQQSEIATASLMLRSGVFAFGVFIILIIKNQLDQYIGANLSYYLIFILALTQFSDILREILHGEQKVDIGGAYDFVQQFLRVFFQIFLILLGFEIFGLIVGLGIGILISLLAGLKFISVHFKMPEKSHFKSLLSYSKFSFGNAVGGYIYEWAGIVIIGFFLTRQYAGIYGVAWGLSGILLLLSQAIASSIYPKISELSIRNEKHDIAEIFSESLVYSPLLVIPAFFGTLILSENLLGLIYGEEFKTGYLVLIILMLARVFQSMQMISVRIIEGMNLPNLVFRVNITTTMMNLFGTLALVYLFGFIGAAIGTMVTILISLLWNTDIVSRILNVKIPFKEIIIQLFSASIMAAIIFGFSKLTPPTMIQNLVFMVFIGAVVYFALLISLSKRIRSKCLSVLKEVIHPSSRVVNI